MTKKLCYSDKHYDVVDYCPRNLVQLQAVDSYELRALSAGKGLSDKDHGPKAAALLTLLQSQAENKTVEWLLTFPSESERRAWSLAFCPPEAKPSEASEPGEKIYADWDCPEVEAVADYSAADDCTELATDSEMANDTVLDIKSGERMKVMRKLTSSGNSETKTMPPISLQKVMMGDYDF